MKIVLTCEHGGNKIPKEIIPYFFQAETNLNSHRGYDLGALDLFKYLKPLADFSKFNDISRLAIELNRSLHHQNLFSEYTKPLTKDLKQELIKGLYGVYRNAVENYIKKQLLLNEEILHVSIHSFTPVLNGIVRTCDIGLLYDSAKSKEKEFCNALTKQLHIENPNLSIRYNYPYLGKADGFTTYLRNTFPDRYMGIELEVNQKFSKDNQMDKALKTTIFNALNTFKP